MIKHAQRKHGIHSEGDIMNAMNALAGVKMNLADTETVGFSVSGLATWMIAPQLNVCFDMGECPLNALPMDHVFLTHAHGDHSRCLMRHHALRKMIGIEREASYYIPESIIEKAKDWIRASALFEGVHAKNVHLPHLIPLSHMSEQSEPIQLTYRKNLSVRSFRVNHGVPSLGYTLYDSRLKLKKEFHHLPGHELAQLKKKGVVIQSPLHTPHFTFIGDCTSKSLSHELSIWRSKVLVIESTFIGDGEERLARQRGHTHLKEIGDLLYELNDEVLCQAIVLKHFSMKVKPLDALEAALRLIPSVFHDRVYLMTSLPKGLARFPLSELAWCNLL